MTTTMYEQIAERQKQREDDKTRQYRDLVRRCAGDEEVSPEEVELLLDHVGKTIADLMQDEAAVRQRNAKRLRVARLPHARVELAEVEQKSNELRERIIAFNQKAKAEGIAIDAQRTSLNGEITQLEEIKRQLMTTTDDPDLKARQRDLGRQGEAIWQEIRGLEIDLTRHRAGTMGDDVARVKQERLAILKARHAEINAEQMELTQAFQAS